MDSAGDQAEHTAVEAFSLFDVAGTKETKSTLLQVTPAPPPRHVGHFQSIDRKIRFNRSFWGSLDLSKDYPAHRSPRQKAGVNPEPRQRPVQQAPLAKPNTERFHSIVTTTNESYKYQGNSEANITRCQKCKKEKGDWRRPKIKDAAAAEVRWQEVVCATDKVTSGFYYFEWKVGQNNEMEQI